MRHLRNSQFGFGRRVHVGRVPPLVDFVNAKMRERNWMRLILPPQPIPDEELCVTSPMQIVVDA